MQWILASAALAIGGAGGFGLARLTCPGAEPAVPPSTVIGDHAIEAALRRLDAQDERIATLQGLLSRLTQQAEQAERIAALAAAQAKPKPPAVE